MTDKEKKEMGIGKNLVRLCFGLEDPDDLIADLDKGLRAASKVVPMAAE